MKEIGETAWIPFFTGGIGNLAGGFLCSGLLRFGLSAQIARRVGVLFFSALMVAAVPAAMVHSSALAIALISTATFGYCGALANVLAIPRDLFPKNAVASIWGLASMGSGFGGMFFSLVTGWLVDHYSFKPAFVLFGLTPIIAAALIWWLPRTIAPALRAGPSSKHLQTVIYHNVFGIRAEEEIDGTIWTIIIPQGSDLFEPSSNSEAGLKKPALVSNRLKPSGRVTRRKGIPADPRRDSER